MNIAGWADEHLVRYGDHDALVVGDRTWRAATLHDEACRLARGLVGAGVKPGDRVLLVLPSGREAVVASSAAWRCGAVVAFVNASAPASELDQVVAHCTPAAVIAGDVLRSWKPAAPVVIDGARLDEIIAREAPLEEPVPRAPDDPAQLCFTSGTTGRLKAAIFAHGGLHAFLSHRRAIAGAPTVTLVALPPTAFSGQLLLGRWASQTTLVVLERFDPREMLDRIVARGITTLPLVPAMAEAVVAIQTQPLPHKLGQVMVSGAHTSPALAAKLEQIFGVAPTLAYGMTEAGGPIAATSPASTAGSVGRVMTGVEVVIVDGEIRVRSPWMARGYWQDTDETAAVFREGWIHTGDLGQLVDGELTLVGRSKDIIIQAGYNVAPRDVVEVIAQVPGVARCAVVGVAHDMLGEEVVACIVRAGALSEQTVLDHCRAHLDARKQPGRVVFLDDLPTTANGKVKTKELRERVLREAPAPSDAAWLARLRDASPEARREIVLAEILALVRACAGETSIDPDATFPQLGLSSMDRVQVVHGLGVKLGKQLPATLVYRHPTPNALATLLAGDIDVEGLDLRTAGVTTCAATNPQTYFATLAAQDPDPTAYYTPMAFLLEGLLDEDALVRSIDAFVAGHAVFRTALREEASGLQQILLTAPDFEVEHGERLDLDPAEWDAEIARTIHALAERFDLPRGRVVAARLTRLALDRHALVIVVHHAASDAESIARFSGRLFDLYRNGGTIEERVSYIDFATALARFQSSPAGQDRLRAWDDRLRDAPPVEIPVDLPRDEVDRRRDAAPRGITADLMHPAEYLQLPPPTREIVQRVAREEGVTAYAVYLSAFAWLLHRKTQQRDICIESSTSMRTLHRDLAAVQGICVTWTILRLDLSASTLRGVLAGAQRIVDEATENGIIADYYRRAPHTIRRAIFNYVPLPDRADEPSHGGLRVIPKRQPFPRWKRPWDLHLTMLDSAGGTQIAWTGNAALFHRETLSSLLQEYLGLLHDL